MSLYYASLNNSATSALVSVTFNPPAAPIINRDISASILSIYLGAGSTFTASFFGNQPIYYQWQHADDSFVFTNIPGATNTSFSVVSATTGSAGYYQLFATNQIGTGVSGYAYVSLLPGTPAYLWSAPIPFAGLTAEQILTNFPANNKIAGAMVAKNGGNPITVILTNANNQPVVFEGYGTWA